MWLTEHAPSWMWQRVPVLCFGKKNEIVQEQKEIQAPEVLQAGGGGPSWSFKAPWIDFKLALNSDRITLRTIGLKGKTYYNNLNTRVKDHYNRLR